MPNVHETMKSIGLLMHKHYHLFINYMWPFFHLKMNNFDLKVPSGYNFKMDHFN